MAARAETKEQSKSIIEKFVTAYYCFVFTFMFYLKSLFIYLRGVPKKHNSAKYIWHCGTFNLTLLILLNKKI